MLWFHEMFDNVNVNGWVVSSKSITYSTSNSAESKRLNVGMSLRSDHVQESEIIEGAEPSRVRFIIHSVNENVGVVKEDKGAGDAQRLASKESFSVSLSM